MEAENKVQELICDGCNKVIQLQDERWKIIYGASEDAGVWHLDCLRFNRDQKRKE